MSQRIDVEFVSGQKGEHCRAWLYEPGEKGPFPIIVMAHGLGGTRKMRLDAFAERFSGAGYACLVFDYRHFGTSEGHPRQLLDIGKQLQDWSSAIGFARKQKNVRADQVVLWGTSFGGGHVLVAAAEDTRVAAVVAQCPFTDGIASALAMDWRSSIKTSAKAVCDVLRSALGLTPLFVPAAGPPRSAAFMTAPDAQPGYLALVPAGSVFDNRVTARSALAIIPYRPGRRAAQLACPVLFCICEDDSVAPAKPALRYARQAPGGEVRLYAQKHFDIYVGAGFEQAVTDQLTFLRRCIS
ncbi:alpha/beta hydrolase [Massilia sp. Mn16-1_5]|uniref:alpha/beta hydrolase n=1 Tax=Massilia sp. Mn16-1_5 TaxID=2079199 RepID=UPI00109EC7DD|nr:alpha/beta hydrolase [Massilia sp. Mn16-1_5]THC46311.1 alpha/beta hydrolase [Massilia sp. Mn16-1_5]